MTSDHGYEINSWEDFLALLDTDDIEVWARRTLNSRHPVNLGWSIPGHSEYVFVFGLLLGLVPRTPKNLCYIIDELPDYLLTPTRAAEGANA